MFGIEQKLFDQLCLLRDHYDLQGIKAEFEAEGSSFRDLVRLRRLTERAGIKLFLKIGGVEAIRDIKDAIEIGVDGIIAPMVESTFGLHKFHKAYKKIYNDYRIHLSINVETRKAVEEIDDVLSYCEGRIDNITVGRSDLSGSYLRDDIYPDSPFILDLIEELADKIHAHGLTLTVGGSINANTIDILNNRTTLAKKIYKLETRKIILPTEKMLASKDSLKMALKFEELYILSKKEFNDTFIGAEMARLTELQRRL